MAVDFILKIDGIKGESKLDKHVDEIELEAFSFTVTNPAQLKAAGGGMSSGRAQLSEMSFSKFTDSASVNLFRFCATGEHIKKAKLFLRKSGKDAQEYLTCEIEEVLVTSWHPGGTNSTDQVNETFTLAFSKIKWEYKPQLEGGGLGGAITASWDLKAAKAS